jgi:hypothetical protein
LLEGECLLNEDVVILEDATVPGSGKMLNCAFDSLRVQSGLSAQSHDNPSLISRLS